MLSWKMEYPGISCAVWTLRKMCAGHESVRDMGRKLRSGDNVREILDDASNGVVFGVDAGVKKGTELFFGYPYTSEGEEIWGGNEDMEEGGSGGE